MLALGQLEHDREVIEPAVQAFQPGQLGVEVGQPPGDCLRVLLVLPQPGVDRPLAQIVSLLPHPFRVEDSLDTGELR